MDDAGNVTGHEVVDLAQQMKDMQQRVATAMAAEDAATVTSSSSSLRGLATSLGQIAEDMDDGEAYEEDDDDYEDLGGGGDNKADMQATADTVAALAKLGELELEEAEWEAAERVREQERLLQERQRVAREQAALPQAGPGGWKKGFLGGGGGGGKKAAAAQLPAEAAKKHVHFGSATAPSLVQAPAPTPASTPTQPRPAAFTGTIMERFP